MIKGATPRQEALADQIIYESKLDLNKRRPKKELLVSVGYKESLAVHKPGEMIDRKGVKIALESKGFSEDAAKKVVAEIMGSSKIKPETRLKATDQVFRVFGSYKEKDGGNGTVNNFEQVAVFLMGKQNGDIEKPEGNAGRSDLGVREDV